MKSAELSPIGSANDDLFGKSLTIKRFSQSGGTVDNIIIEPNQIRNDDPSGNIYIYNSNSQGIIRLQSYGDLSITGEGNVNMYRHATGSIGISQVGIGLETSAGPDMRLKIPDNDVEIDFTQNGGGILKLIDGTLNTEAISYSATPNDKFREVWGSVNGAGTKGAGGSAGWTVAKIATGSYRIKFNPAFPTGSTPTPIVTVAQSNVARYITVQSITPNKFEVRTYTPGALIDTGFNFNVKGPA